MNVRWTLLLAMGLAGCDGGAADVPGGGAGLDGGGTTTGEGTATAVSSTGGPAATTGAASAPTGGQSLATPGEASGPSGQEEMTSTGSTAGGGPQESTGGAPENETGTSPASVCANVTESGTHAAVAAVLAAAAPCGLSSCHGPGLQGEKAGLLLLDSRDLRDLLVDKLSCQAPGLPLVDGQGGDAALANSWLYQKLAGDVSRANEVVAQEGWGASVVCDQSRPDLAPFGMAMPLGTPGLDEAQLAPVRAWICNQAPGPPPSAQKASDARTSHVWSSSGDTNQ